MLKPYFRDDARGILLYRADLFEVMDLLHARKILVDATITDPPYSSGGMFRSDRCNRTTDEKYTQHQNQGRRPNFSGDNMDQRSWSSYARLWMSRSRELTRPSGYLCSFIDWRQLPTLTDVIQHAGWIWRGINTWDKGLGAKAVHTGYFAYQAEFVAWATNGPVKRRPKISEGGEWKLAGVMRETVKQGDKHHQTGKPTPIMKWLVSCIQPGGLVFDPFAGSGTTGVACIETGRKFIGAEIVEANAEIAAMRLEKAIREGNHNGKATP